MCLCCNGFCFLDSISCMFFFFFFQAEDGIRDLTVTGVQTCALPISWWGSEGVGTVPHALIAAYGGDTVLASKKFAELMDGNMRLITLVDFENDCVGTALKVARALGERLYGVRIDTSETLVDKSVIPQMGTFKPTGVNPQLVWNVRRALDG